MPAKKPIHPSLKKISLSFFAVVVVVSGGYFGYAAWSKTFRQERNAERKDTSLAVLRFINLDDRNEDYFSDGVSEGVLNALSRFHNLKISSRHSSFQFDSENADVTDMGGKLSVNNLLSGSVNRQDGQVHISVKLTNVVDKITYWTGTFDGTIENVVFLQHEIAEAVAGKLAIHIEAQERHRQMQLANPPRREAYELYLKGRVSWNLRTPSDLKKGIEYFLSSIAADSNFAPAYSGLADSYTTLGYGSHLAPEETFPKAREAALKALQLDPTLAEPHASLAYYHFYYAWDWQAAEKEFRIALALNPNYALAYDWYGYYLTAMQRYEEAYSMLQQTLTLDPLSVPAQTDMGFSQYYAGDYEAAANILQAAIAMNPRYALAHFWLGRVYQQEKLYDQAISEYTTSLKIVADWPVALAAIGNVYGTSGDKKNALAILTTLSTLSEKKFVTSYGVALVYNGIEEKAQALDWLDRAYDERSHWLVWLRTDPRWLSLHGDPRYEKMISRVGLPKRMDHP